MLPLPNSANNTRNFKAARLPEIFAAMTALFFVAAPVVAHAQSTYFWRVEAPGGNWQ
ncbi:MAG: hypothetical protein JHC52_04090, partial [Chthoniobacterales bacterium]|nr:hypothetical protein [Chthoniobacterales bacterium]